MKKIHRIIILIYQAVLNWWKSRQCMKMAGYLMDGDFFEVIKGDEFWAFRDYLKKHLAAGAPGFIISAKLTDGTAWFIYDVDFAEFGEDFTAIGYKDINIMPRNDKEHHLCPEEFLQYPIWRCSLAG